MVSDIILCFKTITNIIHNYIYACMYYTVPSPISGLLAIPEVVQLHILWIPPSEPNGVITAYEVCFNISVGVFNYTNTSSTQHTLRDLPPNTVVTFSVRAYTIIGPGEYVTGQASTKTNVEPSTTVSPILPGRKT